MRKHPAYSLGISFQCVFFCSIDCQKLLYFVNHFSPGDVRIWIRSFTYKPYGLLGNYNSLNHVTKCSHITLTRDVCLPVTFASPTDHLKVFLKNKKLAQYGIIELQAAANEWECGKEMLDMMHCFFRTCSSSVATDSHAMHWTVQCFLQQSGKIGH